MATTYCQTHTVRQYPNLKGASNSLPDVPLNDLPATDTPSKSNNASKTSMTASHKTRQYPGKGGK